MREAVFEQLPYSRQEKRKKLLAARNILWTISTEIAFGEKDQQKLLSYFEEALELFFCANQCE